VTDALVTRGLSRTFGALVAVRDVSLAVCSGERRAVIGSNGAGKSTLFNLIAGDIAPTGGSLVFQGRPIGSEPPWRRARLGISRTYQTSRVLAGLDVRQNLYLAVRGVHPGRFGLGRTSARDPHWARTADIAATVGLSGQLERGARELSHGERRQLEIGMALAAGPSLLLLDEPAAGLSPAERPVLASLLAALPREMTIILIEHDMDVALGFADRVTVMSEGTIVFEGSPDETQSSALVQSLYLGRTGKDHAA
jgi:branched-chain amino acid transport system ATP-binding protein